MSYALIHGINLENAQFEPLFAQGVNTENSFYTDGPSITAVQGFVNALTDLPGLKYERKGRFFSGIKINGIAFIIHHYERNVGKVAFKSGTSNYINEKDQQNPPVPTELFSAEMRFSIIIDFDGKLPQENDVDDIVNASTRRFNGGEIMNDIMLSTISDEILTKYLKRFKGNQVVDRSDLCLTTWDEMFEYIGFFENIETKRRDIRKHDGIYYAHQTGFMLLEAPKKRKGALLFNEAPCRHAYCEPVINLAQLKHTTHISSVSDICFWKWHEDLASKTVTLSSDDSINSIAIKLGKENG